MPLLSEFYGIKIFIYWDDHYPPHFHAEYNGNQVLVNIETNVVIRGVLPANKLKLILGWAEIHHEELQDCWEKAKNNQMPTKIAPLN